MLVNNNSGGLFILINLRGEECVKRDNQENQREAHHGQK